MNRAGRFTGFLLTVLGCMVGASMSGCAHRVWNHRLDDLKPAARYEFSNRLPDNAEDLFIVLAFSGGGTRAASFGSPKGCVEHFRDREARGRYLNTRA